MIEEIREMFQNFIAPQLEGIRGDIRAVDVKVDSFRRELLTEIRRVEEVLSGDFVRLEQKVDLKLANFDTRLSALNDSVHQKLASIETRMDHRFAVVESKLATMVDKVAGMDQKFATLDQKFAAMDQKFAAMSDRFATMDQKFEIMTEKLEVQRRELLAELKAAR